jgi:hypothetical protein
MGPDRFTSSGDAANFRKAHFPARKLAPVEKLERVRARPSDKDH